jgi:shikimate dehydrogenase
MRNFGLIGYPLSHSFSKKYFTEKFQQLSIEAVYENYPIPGIEGFEAILDVPQLEGVNVTIPYKEAVIPFLDYKSTVVEAIGACNCIAIKNGQLFGHNTDVIGFDATFSPALRPQHTKALVLGTGGAAKAVYYILQQKNIDFLKVSRTTKQGQLCYSDLTEEIISTHTIIINTTPLGMYPNVHDFPPIPYEWIGKNHYLYDLVYNPAISAFLAKGIAQGAVTENGAKMLEIQAEESWKIWNY